MRDLKNKARIPRQQRSIQTKKQIIDAAMRLFAEKGFHATNTKEIAKTAGVATGCFYSYFTDKKDVFLEALQIYHEQFSAVLDEHVTRLYQPNLAKKNFLKGMVTGILEAHKVFTDFHNELIVMYYSDPDIRKLTEEFDRRSIQFTLEYLRREQNQLRIADLEAAASVVYRAVHSVVDVVSAVAAEDQKQRLIAELVDMIAVYLFGNME